MSGPLSTGQSLEDILGHGASLQSTVPDSLGAARVAGGLLQQGLSVTSVDNAPNSLSATANRAAAGVHMNGAGQYRLPGVSIEAGPAVTQNDAAPATPDAPVL